MRNLTFLIVTLLIFGCQSEKPEENKQEETYELVILNANVMDPETGIDTIMNIGINGGTIQKLTTDGINGDKAIDASGKVAAPGFIDLHTHSPFPLGESVQVRDGATTILDLESGAYPAIEYGHLSRIQREPILVLPRHMHLPEQK
ncbi:MAG: hypothetical protein P8X57_11120 [Cyclobacteriaceae bacterium]